jgi:hypothetical protein
MATEAAGNRGRVLRVTLCEIERGVFFASYPDAGPFIDLEEIYQVGASAADAKRQIEKAVRTCGYDTVVWKDDLAVPLFATNPGYPHPVHTHLSHREPARARTSHHSP